MLVALADPREFRPRSRTSAPQCYGNPESPLFEHEILHRRMTMCVTHHGEAGSGDRQHWGALDFRTRKAFDGLYIIARIRAALPCTTRAR
ncbi:hypothetical protein GCM10012278_07770 [Nonomuraea glycinis]|uniref:Uncharacterized protein n=1 Tax=Nonomuraea glycinis TaxID=2047744 RepID=A0A918A1L2_9ACTN|nr:hypothetical protein GCM10012278_07770 [Nonomuraea glycinis]